MCQPRSRHSIAMNIRGGWYVFSLGEYASTCRSIANRPGGPVPSRISLRPFEPGSRGRRCQYQASLIASAA
eukprot:1328134-Rhodomonas_salina.2